MDHNQSRNTNQASSAVRREGIREHPARRHPENRRRRSSDVLRYVAYARADIARLLINQSYSDKQQVFLDFVLSHYIDQGVQELEPTKLSRLLELKYRSLSDARLVLGSNGEMRDLFRDFQPLLYAD